MVGFPRDMTMPSLRRKRIHLVGALFLLLSCLVIPATAIYASQAGVVDWYVISRSFFQVCRVYTHPKDHLRHHTWIGKTRWSALTSPSRLVVSTERNMLASINTDTGAIGRKLLFYYMHVFLCYPFFSNRMASRIRRACR